MGSHYDYDDTPSQPSFTPQDLKVPERITISANTNQFSEDSVTLVLHPDGKVEWKTLRVWRLNNN